MSEDSICKYANLISVGYINIKFKTCVILFSFFIVVVYKLFYITKVRNIIVFMAVPISLCTFAITYFIATDKKVRILFFLFLHENLLIFF